MVRNPNQKIYQTHIPREYLLLKLDKYEDGKLCSKNDNIIVSLLDEDRPIGEAITLTSNISKFPSVINAILCRRYFRIIKTYIHEYNLEKKRNRHNKETT